MRFSRNWNGFLSHDASRLAAQVIMGDADRGALQQFQLRGTPDQDGAIESPGKFNRMITKHLGWLRGNCDSTAS
jgi:hypothetical protein